MGKEGKEEKEEKEGKGDGSLFPFLGKRDTSHKTNSRKMGKRGKTGRFSFPAFGNLGHFSQNQW